MFVAARKEVIHVTYFKITKTWAVKAETEGEAIKLVAADKERLGYCCQRADAWIKQQAIACLPTVHHVSGGREQANYLRK